MNRAQQANRDAKQLFRGCFSNGQFDEQRARLVAQSVSQATNRNRFLILTRLRRLVQIETIKHTATIESAEPLSAAMQESIQSGLASKHGLGLAISFRVTPHLLGGMRITVGNDVYDGSVQGRLADLSRRF